MIGIGLIGTGRIGRIHGGNVAAHAGARLVSVADALPKAAADFGKATGARAESVEALIAAKDIDAVMICSPTDTHADLIEAATRAGKAVFCEKPVDLDSKRIRACLKIVAKTGKPLMIGFNRRFDPHFAAVKARIKAGEIGAVELVTILSRDPAPPPVEYIKRSGGLFRDMMI
ncbi:MAG: Gfo/Idh/MocA family oxidoreductase, partial [Beijerinckiaceae bacterium]